MRTAVNDLVTHSPADKPLLLHILVKEDDAAAIKLKVRVQNYINTEIDASARSQFLPVNIPSSNISTIK